MALQVNLLPAQYRPQPPVRIWPVVLTVILSLNLILTGTYWLTLHLDKNTLESQIQSQENDNINTQRRIDENQWKAELKEAVVQKDRFIDEQITASVLWSSALTVIESSLIPGVVITSISLSGEGAISVTATVDGIKTAMDFWASLQAATGREGIWLYNAPAKGDISLSLVGWYGREAPTDEE